MASFLEKRRNIAIINTGIRGLRIAYLLYFHYTAKIYEENDYIGHHSCTINVHTIYRKVGIDNIKDILKFKKNAHSYLEYKPAFRLKKCFKDLQLGHWFPKYYLPAMVVISAKELASKWPIIYFLGDQAQGLEKHKSSLSETEDQIFALDICSYFKCITFFSTTYNKAMRFETLDIYDVYQIIKTNLLGTFDALCRTVYLLKSGFYPQIALSESLRGYMRLPGVRPYSARKPSIINPRLLKKETAKKNDFNIFMITIDKKAAIFITDGFLRKIFDTHFPRKFTFLLKLIQFLTYELSTKIPYLFNHKEKSWLYI